MDIWLGDEWMEIYSKYHPQLCPVRLTSPHGSIRHTSRTEGLLPDVCSVIGLKTALQWTGRSVGAAWRHSGGPVLHSPPRHGQQIRLREDRIWGAQGDISYASVPPLFFLVWALQAVALWENEQISDITVRMCLCFYLYFKWNQLESTNIDLP